MAHKIVYLIDQLRVGGTEKQLVELVNRINKDKFSVEVFTLKKEPGELASNIKCPVSSVGIEKLCSVETVKKIKKFINYLNENDIKILQTFFPESTILGAICGKISRKPITIGTRRDIGTWHSRLNRSFLRLSNNFYDNILVNSEAVKKDAIERERINPHKITIIHNGIDISLYENLKPLTRSSSEKDNIVIGIISNFLRPVKRLDLFLRGMALVQSRFPHSRFIVVGAVPVGTIEKVPPLIEDKVQFMGSTQDIRPLLAKIDIGVICSDSEGFCNVVLEYMASGIPCVCTDTGGNQELIEDGKDGFLFPPGEEAGLVEKIAMLIDDLYLRQQVSVNAKKKLKEHFAWARIISKYEKYYLSLLE